MDRREKLQDLLLILNTFYVEERGVKFLQKKYSDPDTSEKIEEGIDIAFEMLYDKMDEGELLTDIAQLLKNNSLITSAVDKNPKEYTKSDYKVGQIVYLRKFDKGRSQIVESKISKVGRKYVTLSTDNQFEIKSGVQKTDHAKGYELYLTKEEAMAEQKKDDVYQMILQFSHRSNLDYLTKNGIDTLEYIFKNINH